MSNWGYVAIAYAVTWGALAFYGLALARRVNQARQIARALRDTSQVQERQREQDTVLCDVPPAP